MSILGTEASAARSRNRSLLERQRRLPAPLGEPAPLTGERGLGEAWRRHTSPIEQGCQKAIHNSLPNGAAGGCALGAHSPPGTLLTAPHTLPHCIFLDLQGANLPPASPFSPGRGGLRFREWGHRARHTASQWPSGIHGPCLSVEERDRVGQRPTPDGAAEEGPGHSRAKGRGGEPTAHASSSPGGQAPCCGRRECWLWSFKGSVCSAGKWEEQNPSPGAPRSCRQDAGSENGICPGGKPVPKKVTSSTIPFR